MSVRVCVPLLRSLSVRALIDELGIEKRIRDIRIGEGRDKMRE